MEKGIFKALSFAISAIINFLLIVAIILFVINGEGYYAMISALIMVVIDYIFATLTFRNKQRKWILGLSLILAGSGILLAFGLFALIEARNNSNDFIILSSIGITIGFITSISGQFFFYKEEISTNQNKPIKKFEKNKEKEVITFKRELNDSDISKLQESKNKFKVSKIQDDERFEINHVEMNYLKEKLISVQEYVDLLKSRKKKLSEADKYKIPFFDQPIDYGNFLIKKIDSVIDEFKQGKKVTLEDYERLIYRPNSGYDLEYIIKKINKEPKLKEHIKLKAKNFNFYSLIFTNLDFSDVDFSDVFIVNSNFENCSFIKNNSERVIIDNSNFININASKSVLNNFKISNSTFRNITLEETELNKFEMANIKLNNINGDKSKLLDVQAKNSDINTANLNEAIIENVLFDKINHQNINFNKSRLTNLTFKNSILKTINLEDINFENLNFASKNQFNEIIFSSSFIEKKIFTNIKIDQNQEEFVKNIFINKNNNIKPLGDLVQFQLIKTYTQ